MLFFKVQILTGMVSEQPSLENISQILSEDKEGRKGLSSI